MYIKDSAKQCIAMVRKNSGSRAPKPTTPRQSPFRGRSPEGHYAGCKWTEPPLPSALPLPPQHWMQAPHFALPFRQAKVEQQDIDSQHKVLLKVQA